MKVLYIGVLRDGSGWSHAANDTILAMDKVGIDVVPRSISFKTTFSPHDEIPARVKELMDNDESGCDICIQHIPPSSMSYNGHFKNIGYFESETSHFSNSGWQNYLNTMDEIWIPNAQMSFACNKSGVNKIPKIIPHACDTSRYSQYYDKIKNPQFDNKFIFYTICDFNRRKNIAALLKAFHTEFHPSEPVGLFIKCGSYRYSDKECYLQLGNLINNVKKSLRLYPKTEDYIQEVIVTNRMSEKEIMRIHASFDCFVSPSFGEAWNIPAFDAMAIGKTPICTKVGGHIEYIENNKNGFLIDGQPTPVFFDANETMPFGLFCGNESWIDINVYELRNTMRKIYSMGKEDRQEMAGNGIDRAHNFSHYNIGTLIKNQL